MKTITIRVEAEDVNPILAMIELNPLMSLYDYTITATQPTKEGK